MLRRSLIFTIIMVAICLGLTPANSSPKEHLTKAQIEDRLGYLVALPSFSPSKPLSQNILMGWVKERAGWDRFPNRYTFATGEHRDPRNPNIDGYITRPMARRFTHDMVGQDLRIWNPQGYEYVIGNNLGWIDNSSNSTHFPPDIRIQGKINESTQRIMVRFNMFYTDRGAGDPAPEAKIASGTAVLQSIAGNWTVTSWQIKRNRHWNYRGGL